MRTHLPMRSIVSGFSRSLTGLLLTAVALWGQATTSVRGIVQDTAGAVIPESSVTLTSASTGFKRQALTDAGGGYQFLQVPPGTFALAVEKPGFASITKTDVALQVNTPATVNVTLQIGAVSESVNVEAEVVQLNTVDAAIGNAFNQSQVRQLPLITRNVVELLSLQPGVTPTGEVLGARRDQNNVTLDGVDANDNQNAGLENSKGNASTPGYNINTNGVERPGGFNGALPVPLDSVQEFRVTVGGQGANQGRSSGGQVSLVTKSGSNDFHGSAYEFHRNTVTSANNWFSNRAGIAREKLIRNQFGASLGGRIIRDRAFFFFNYEQRTDASAANQLRRVPSETLKQGIIQMQTSSGIISLSPAQVRQIDPLKIGASPAMLAMFNQMPAGNDPGTGLDGGLNFSAFRFNAPLSLNYKAYVGKMDFHLDQAGKHTLSVRGTLAGNKNDEILAQYPGQSPAAVLLNNSRGISTMYTAVVSANVVNVATFGLTRVGLQRTGGLVTGLTLDNIDTLTNTSTSNRGFTRIAPTYNVADDMTWSKGSHTLTTGANLRFIRNGRTDFKNAFPAYGISRGSLQGLGADIITAAEDFTGVRSSVPAVLSRAFQQVTGVVATGSMTFSYDRQGKPLAIGTPPVRNFATNEAEFYVSDSWRVKPSFTVNYGVRYSKYGVPYEKNGLQVAPTFPLEAFYAERLGGQSAGIPSNALPHALLQYDFVGPANDKGSWYKGDSNNFAPRLGIAWAPTKGDAWYNKILGNGGVLRLGGALVYDRFGSDLVTQFDSNASFGLTDIKNLGQSFNFTTGSRYNGTFPTIPNAPNHVFPFTPPEVTSICCNYMGMSTDLRTPYSYALNASFARQLPGGMTMEVGYAGRLSRKLLMQLDAGGWALLFKDPKSGQNWKEMSAQIRQLHDAGVDPRAVTTNPGLVPQIPFIENMFPGLKDNYFPGSASANYYQLIWGQYGGSDADATHAVDRLRSAKFPNCITVTGCFTLYPVQSSGNSMWTNVGFASYHAATLSVRKPFSKGVSFDFNYTLGHSIDNGGGPEAGGGSAGGIMLNPYNYGAFRGSSDFDIRHNVNANVLYELPFGKGKKMLTNASGVLQNVVGGWQLSSIMRYRSGLPTAVAYTGLWPTNFSFNTIAYPVAPFESKVGTNQLGNPSVFANTNQASNWRPMYPGEVGLRAALRLDDLMNFDISVAKSFFLPWEGHRMQFRAEAFNAFNNVSFTNPALDANTPSNFGQFTGALAPRVMQFALRYEF